MITRFDGSTGVEDTGLSQRRSATENAIASQLRGASFTASPHTQES